MQRRLTSPETPEHLKRLSFGDVDLLFKRGKEIKRGRQQSVRLCSIFGEQIMVKRYELKGLFPALRTCIGLSRASNSLRYADILRRNEIPCPAHYLVVSDCQLRSARTYLLMEQVSGIRLGDYFSMQKIPECLGKTIDAAIHTIQTFHTLGLSHGDLHALNFIVRDLSTAVLIDLDNVKKAPGRQSKDLHRFVDSIPKENATTATIVKKIRCRLIYK